MTRSQPLRRVWGQDQTTGSGPVRAIVRRLRRKLGDDPDNPSCILTKPSVGYRMEEGKTPEQREA